MTDSRANIPSIVERTRPVKAGAPVVAAHFLGQTAVFVLGEGALVLAPRAGEARSVPVHGGAILATAADGARIVTGGDDGKVVATDAEGDSTTIAADAKQRWIDHVAVGPAGPLAWSAGPEACVAPRQGLAAHARSAVDRRRPCLHAERPAPRHRPLQRPHALVRECAERAGTTAMEGVPSRRGGEPRRTVRRHIHAGADVARLAAR